MGAGDQPGEFALIARHFKPLAGEGAFDLADDAALLHAGPDDGIVVTTDMLVAGVHFRAGDPPEAIAAKALRVNLSDLAGKGAEPFAYLLALGLGDGWTEDWVARFAAGLAADQGRYGVSLIGGDTSGAGGRTVIAITAFGRLPAGSMVHRSGARPGDVLVVTGTIGDAALALRAEAAGTVPEHLRRRYLYPEPRVAIATAIRAHAHAALDVSDGLVADLGHICDASGVGAEIEAALVPLSVAARRLVDTDPEALGTALTGGDDYEVLAAVPPPAVDRYRADCAAAGVETTTVGRIIAGEGPPVVLGRNGRPMSFPRGGWDHFAVGAGR